MKTRIYHICACIAACTLLTSCGLAGAEPNESKPTPTEESETVQEIDTAEATEPAKEAEATEAADNNYVPADPDLAFESQDIYGNPVSSDIFSKADVTVVNIWGTFCDPCIGELPHLEEWRQNMPDNVQIIGIVCNSYEADDRGAQDAQFLVEQAGVKYTNIITGSDMYDLMSQFEYVPTTILVDREGNRIGEPITGAYVDAYKKAVSDYLSNE
jgi:thiol-disulfide isomerase/thioredoxin